MTIRYLADRYASTLADYFACGGESVLPRAHEIGRLCLIEGLGVLEITVLYHQALARALERSHSPEESVRIVRAGESFFLESLAPFEIGRRGHHAEDDNRRDEQAQQHVF